MTRAGPNITLDDQTGGSATCLWHDTLVSALADQTTEICTAQGQMPPAFCTRCVQQSVRIVLLPYFLSLWLRCISEEQLGFAVLPKE
jgi:hypothetical protein